METKTVDNQTAVALERATIDLIPHDFIEDNGDVLTLWTIDLLGRATYVSFVKIGQYYYQWSRIRQDNLRGE